MNRRDLFQLAAELGWRFERQTKHGYRFRRGAQVASLPTTPSDQRSVRNFAADLRRRPTQEETT